MGVLDGKAALVTGGSQGIGRAIVRRLAADGASVMFSFHDNQQAADDVAAQVAGDGGLAVAAAADQGILADTERLVQESGRQPGGLDILVCNAAVNIAAPILEATEPDYDRVMDVNAKGPFFAMQYAGRILHDGGRIITTSTLNTAVPVPGAALYAASKAAPGAIYRRGRPRVRAAGNYRQCHLARRHRHRPAAPQ